MVLNVYLKMFTFRLIFGMSLKFSGYQNKYAY